MILPRWRRALPAAVPALLTVVLLGSMASGVLANPVVLGRARLALVVLTVGLALTLATAVGLAAARGRRRWGARGSEHRDDFYRRLSHEVRNPLGGVVAQLDQIAQLADSPEVHACVEAARTQAHRVGHLIETLREIEHLQTRAGQAAMNRHPVDVVNLLQEVQEDAQRRIPPDGPKLNAPVAVLGMRGLVVLGDRDLLCRAIQNLLENAIKFSGPNATVELHAYRDRSWLVIAVTDDGPGIPAEDLSHVWEELYRGRAARARRVPGDGTGLALVRAIAVGHGGEAEIESQVDRGTRAALRLPLSPRPRKPAV